MAKGNFLLDDSWKSMFVDLPDEAAGKLIKAAFCYHTGEDFDLDDPVIAAIFSMIRDRIDENDRKYADTCEKRAAAGQRGGKAKASKGKQKLANASKPKQSLHDSEYDNDIKENLSPKGDSQKKVRPRFCPPSVDEVRAYCLERKNGIDAQAFVDFYQRQSWKLSNGVNMSDWKASVRTWEQRNKEKSPKPRGAPNRFTESVGKHDYNFADLEKQILEQRLSG